MAKLAMGGTGRLAGRKAPITDGDSDIGRAAAIAFAREGIDVAISYLPAEEPDAMEVARLIQEAGRKAVATAGRYPGRGILPFARGVCGTRPGRAGYSLPAGNTVPLLSLISQRNNSIGPSRQTKGTPDRDAIARTEISKRDLDLRESLQTESLRGWIGSSWNAMGLDVEMPLVDGLATARILAELYPAATWQLVANTGRTSTVQ